MRSTHSCTALPFVSVLEPPAVVDVDACKECGDGRRGCASTPGRGYGAEPTTSQDQAATLLCVRVLENGARLTTEATRLPVDASAADYIINCPQGARAVIFYGPQDTNARRAVKAPAEQGCRASSPLYRAPVMAWRWTGMERRSRWLGPSFRLHGEKGSGGGWKSTNK